MSGSSSARPGSGVPFNCGRTLSSGNSMSSYVWLNSKLDMAVLGPEKIE